MRDGEHIATHPVKELSRERLIELMVGRKLEAEFPKRSAAIGESRLVVRDLRRGKAVRGVGFELRRGEVLGLAGLVGAGRTETVRMLFGADRAEAGRISLDGRELRIRSPRDAIKAGICLLTEDRKQQGLVLGLSMRSNFGLPNLDLFSRFSLSHGKPNAMLLPVMSASWKSSHRTRNNSPEIFPVAISRKWSSPSGCRQIPMS